MAVGTADSAPLAQYAVPQAVLALEAQAQAAGAASSADSHGGTASASAAAALSAAVPVTGAAASALASPSPSGRPNPRGLLHDVIMMGAPVSGDPAAWAPVRRIAAGRVVSCYCRGDVVLRLVHRGSQLAWQVAGAGPIGSATKTTVTVQGSLSVSQAAGQAEAGSSAAPEARPVALATAGAPVTGATRAVQAGAGSFGAAARSTRPEAQAAAAGVATGSEAIGTGASAFSSNPVAQGRVPAVTDRVPTIPTIDAATTWLDGVESIDVSHIVGGHVDYRAKLAAISCFISLEGSGC